MRLDPWNPMQVADGTRMVINTFDFALSADPQVIAPADPSRLFFLVYQTDGVQDFGVYLKGTNPTGGIKPQSGSNSVLIHTCNMPAATQLQWFGYSMVGGNLTVIDVAVKR